MRFIKLITIILLFNGVTIIILFDGVMMLILDGATMLLLDEATILDEAILLDEVIILLLVSAQKRSRWSIKWSGNIIRCSNIVR